MKCACLSRDATIASVMALTLLFTAPATPGAPPLAGDDSPAETGPTDEAALDAAQRDDVRLVALPERPRAMDRAVPALPCEARGLPVKISGSMVAGGDAVSFQISPDGSTVVYHADQDADGSYDLYAVPIGGGTPLRLTGPSALNSGADFRISPDSATVVYWNSYDIYSVDITGGTPVWLDETVPPSDHNVFSYLIAPDSTTVVFTVNDSFINLYSVPISGGTATKLNASYLSFYSSYYYGISSDSSSVLYLSYSQLYTVPITGGTPLQLNGPLVAGGGLSAPFSEFMGTTVYRADQETDEVYELYSVPTAGGSWVKLNGPLTIGGDVTSWYLSYDSVYYRADQKNDEVFELYGVPKEGGTAVRLNGLLTVGGDVGGFRPTHDESYVTYLADQDTDDVVELYSVPGSGGSATRLNDPLVAGGDVLAWAVVGGVDMAGYMADQDTDEMVEVYAVPVSGGTAGKCSGTMVAGGDVSGGTVGWRGLLWYLADQDTDETVELYVGPLDGSVAPVKLNGLLVAGGDVTTYSIAEPWIVYMADQDTDEVFELYSVMLDGDIDVDGAIDGLDCIVYDPDVWSYPGDATGLALSGGDPTTLSWSAPADLGGTSVLYDTVRSTDPGDFGPDATCIESDDGADTVASDGSTPASGEAFFYLIRAENVCGGEAGATSTGEARAVRDCS